MANRIQTQVGIAAPVESVWKTLTDTTVWEKWYGAPVIDAEWKEDGKITFGGQYSSTEIIKNYKEGKTFTIDGPWMDTVYTLREVPEGTYLEKLRIGKGATWVDSKVEEEVQKLQSELRKFAELVPEPDEKLDERSESILQNEPKPTEKPEPILESELKPTEIMDCVSGWKYTELPVNPVDTVAHTSEDGGTGKKKRRLIIIGAAALVFAVMIIVLISQLSGNITKDSYTWGEMEFKITKVTDDLSSVNVDMKEAANGKWVAAALEIQNDKGIQMKQLSDVLFNQQAALLDGEPAKNFSVSKVRFQVNGGIADGTLTDSFVILFDMPADYTPSVSDIYINENVNLTEIYNTPTPTTPTTPAVPTPATPTVGY